MPKPSQPAPSPSVGDEDPVWGGPVRICRPPAAKPGADRRYTHASNASAAAAAHDAEEEAELPARATGQGREP